MLRFIITDRAGPWIAGQRNPGAGTVLELTQQQAAHELRLGTIVHDQPSGARGRKTRDKADTAQPEPDDATAND